MAVRSILYTCALDFVHLSSKGVAKIAESTNLKGCPHTFVYVVNLCVYIYIFLAMLVKCALNSK